MILNLKRKFLFIHIPRCAGTSFTRVLHSVFPRSLVVNLEWKHARASEIKGALIPDNLWDSYMKFAFMRSPWEIIESMWKHTAKYADVPVDASIHVAEGWIKRLKKFKEYKSFTEYVVDEFFERGDIVIGKGFYSSYCQINGEDAGVQIYQFADLDAAWTDLQNRLEIPKNVKLPKLNEAGGPRPTWTHELIQQVGNICSYDVERFGYVPPTIL